MRCNYDDGERRCSCRVCEAVCSLGDSPRRKSIGRDGASCCESRRRNTPGWSISVWFWCVRGRVEWAMRRCEESWGQPRQEVVWPRTGSHTLRCSRSSSCSCSCSCSCSNGTFGSGVFAVESTGLSVAMGHDAPTPSGSRLASDRLTHPTVFAVESTGLSVAMGHDAPAPSTSRLAFRPAHTPYGVRGRVRARARARARARMERLVLVCSRSSRVGYERF